MLEVPLGLSNMDLQESCEMHFYHTDKKKKKPKQVQVAICLILGSFFSILCFVLLYIISSRGFITIKATLS